MNEGFESSIERIQKAIPVLLSKGEEATKQSVILPILFHLGWDIHDISEVEPEYSIGSGRVDYCLKIRDKKLFIEVKRMNEDLENHEKQLLEYSFQEGVEIAVLTNGRIWLFYLPTEPGHWQQRKFFTIDFNQQTEEVIIKHFNEFLNKSGISSGACLEKAKTIKQGKEKEKAINKSIPEAWKELLSGPDEMIIEIFANKVEGICGHRPEPELLADFILKNQKSTTLASDNTLRVMKPAHSLTKFKLDIQSNEVTKFKIGDNIFDAIPVTKLYYEVLKFLCQTGRIGQMPMPFETSAKRYLIAKESYHQNGNEFRVPVGYAGYYMEAHKDRKNALNHLGNFLKSGGIEYSME